MGKRLNFTFEEFFKSDEAKKLGLDNTTKNPTYLNNWMNLVHFVLQPVRDKIVKNKIGSCLIICGAFRCPELVRIKGWSKTGHPQGECADLKVPQVSSEKLFYFIKDMIVKKEIDVDQLIWEKDSNCVHVGYRGTSNRNQVMIRTIINGKFDYKVV